MERELSTIRKGLLAQSLKTQSMDNSGKKKKKKTLGTFGNSSITKEKISRITATNL